MRAAQTPRTSVLYPPSILAGDSHQNHPIPTQDLIRGGRLRHLGTGLRSIVSAGLRSLVLIAIAMLLILVLLPAALVAAGT